MSETDKIMTFVEGLRSATQSEVDYHMPDKLEDSMKMAINFDDAHFHKTTTASKSIAKPPPRRERIVYVPRLETPSSDTAEPMDLDAINRAKERFTKKSDKTTSSSGGCYRCGKTGHIARNCKGKAKDKSVVISTVEKSNEKPKENAECHTMVKHPSEPEQLEDERERLIRFNGSINKKKAWLLLDSGSAQNFIDKSFVK
jgi:Zinc knuckle